MSRTQPPKTVTTPPDDRSPLALAAAWSARVTTIALEMVIPGMIGLWIDRQLGTVMVFLVLGVVLGMTVGMLHLVRLGVSAERGSQPKEKSEERRLGE